MRRFLFISIAIICCLFAGCEQGGGESTTPPPEQINVSNIDNNAEEFVVADYTEITLSGLDTDGLYGIFPEMTGSRASVSPEADSPRLIVTDAGTRLLKPESDTVTLSGSDVGISGAGTVKILKYEESTEATIDTGKDCPLYHDDIENADVYEKYSKVDISDFEDKNLALLFYDYNKEKGGVSMSTDYGVIDPESGSLSRDAKSHGVMNFEGKETVEIFNQVRHRDGSNVVSMVLVQNPEVISENGTIAIKNKHLYRINKGSWGDKTVVMELELNDGIDIENLFLADSATDIRYASGEKNGQRHPYFFPLSWNESTKEVVIYIGQIDEDIIFDVAANNNIDEIGRATLREITDEEKPQEIRVADSLVEEITIDKDSYFTPVVLLGGEDIRGMNMKAEFDGSFSVRLVEGHTSGVGYSQCGLSSGDTRYDKRGRNSSSFFEYVVIKNNYDAGKQGGSVKLSFAHGENFSDSTMLKIGEEQDCYLGQKYMLDFTGDNIIFEMKLDNALDSELVKELADITHNSNPDTLLFVPVHYDTEKNTVYVDAGKADIPVAFRIGSEQKESRKIGTIKPVVKDDNTWWNEIDVSEISSGKPEIVVPEMNHSPFMAYRVEGDNIPDSWALTLDAPDEVIAKGIATVKGIYAGKLSVSGNPGNNYGSVTGVNFTAIFFADPGFGEGGERHISLTIDDLN